jgi:hypothetical protein
VRQRGSRSVGWGTQQPMGPRRGACSSQGGLLQRRGLPAHCWGRGPEMDGAEEGLTLAATRSTRCWAAGTCNRARASLQEERTVLLCAAEWCRPSRVAWAERVKRAGQAGQRRQQMHTTAGACRRRLDRAGAGTISNPGQRSTGHAGTREPVWDGMLGMRRRLRVAKRWHRGSVARHPQRKTSPDVVVCGSRATVLLLIE